MKHKIVSKTLKGYCCQKYRVYCKISKSQVNPIIIKLILHNNFLVDNCHRIPKINSSQQYKTFLHHHWLLTGPKIWKKILKKKFWKKNFEKKLWKKIWKKMFEIYCFISKCLQCNLVSCIIMVTNNRGVGMTSIRFFKIKGRKN